MKIFCVGFQKTGTSSMGKALEALGFSVKGAHGTKDPKISERVYDVIEQFVPLYDAFQDNPWPVLYEHLDRRYPDSKFILTVRDSDSWLKSIIRHCGPRGTPMREWIYGYPNPVGHEREYVARFDRHNAEVQEYFAGRHEKDFLVMDLQQGDGWDKLCPFLAKEVVNHIPFPHRNRHQDRKAQRRIKVEVSRLLRRLRLPT